MFCFFWINKRERKKGMQNQLTTQMSSVPNAVVVTTYTGSKSTSSTFNNILAHVSLLRSARRFIGVYKAVCEGEKTSRSFDLAYKNFVNQDSISLAPQNDIANIEKGLIVLHGAYQSAKKDKQIFVPISPTRLPPFQHFIKQKYHRPIHWHPTPFWMHRQTHLPQY